MKNYLILLVFLIICINSKAQNQIIGNLKDEKTQKNIPFATITFTNRNLGTYSDENGNFKLDAQQTDSLIQISSIGYQSKILNANNIPISIYLNPISEDLEEIVISKAKPNYKKSVHFGLP